MKTDPARFSLPRRGVRLPAHPAFMAWVAGVVILGALMAFGRLSPIDGLGSIFGLGIVTAIAARLGRQPRDDNGETDSKAALDANVTRFADTLAEPCIVVDERAVLVYANPAAASHFPRARIGDPLAFTLRNPELVEAVGKAGETRTAQRAELHITSPVEVWYRAAVVPYRPQGDEGAGFMVISLYDFTEQKRTDRMRGDFIANASHELRTPLTSLMGFIDTLQGPAANDEKARARFLNIMRGQAERMSALIDDLLSLSRIELRQHVKPTGEVNLTLLVREVAESLEARLKKNDVTLELDLPAGPVMVRGERQELFEVLENLADNAIKYGGSAGRIEIALVAGASRSGTHHAITVTDFGPGVPEEHVPRLTERFYRVDSETTRGKKGTGLGLAIVKHIISRHHGELSIRSRPGEGTRVEILLPG
ncbi:sensor histidine kinase [Pelagibacterium sediminicola]|uniref:sensor histidine kinase n=1 Tax=Pelagibacterium sediminicola TaxID=2248761 RepID=UPI000E31AD3C|nr:ATP-binding protein [Pelagibacterium sediminicola]